MTINGDLPGTRPSGPSEPFLATLASIEMAGRRDNAPGRGSGGQTSGAVSRLPLPRASSTSVVGRHLRSPN